MCSFSPSFQISTPLLSILSSSPFLSHVVATEWLPACVSQRLPITEAVCVCTCALMEKQLSQGGLSLLSPAALSILHSAISSSPPPPPPLLPWSWSWITAAAASAERDEVFLLFQFSLCYVGFFFFSSVRQCTHLCYNVRMQHCGGAHCVCVCVCVILSLVQPVKSHPRCQYKPLNHTLTAEPSVCVTMVMSVAFPHV